MKTVQMTIDEHLLKQVDDVVAIQGTSRSAFVRQALEAALRRWRVQQLEAQHRAGYQQLPVAAGEFDDWEDEQDWGDGE